MSTTSLQSPIHLEAYALRDCFVLVGERARTLAVLRHVCWLWGALMHEIVAWRQFFRDEADQHCILNVPSLHCHPGEVSMVVTVYRQQLQQLRAYICSIKPRLSCHDVTLKLNVHLLTARPSQGKCLSCVAAANGLIYVMGGHRGRASSMCEEYNPATDAWTLLPSMAESRYLACAAAYDGCIYVFGGVFNGDGQTPTQQSDGCDLGMCEKYDPSTMKWSSICSLRSARYGSCAVTLDNRIFVVGGNSHGVTFIVASGATCEVYDPLLDAFSPIRSMRTPRYGPCAAAAQGNIFVFGGNHGPYRHSCERYDPSSDTWVAISNLSAPRAWACAAAVGDRIFIMGGEGSRALKTCEVYDVFPRC